MRIGKRALVPLGYPSSVAEEYFEYQLWDTVQGLCSYVRGIQCTSALLETAGVGRADASAAAAAIAWVMRDGFASVASLIFSACFAGNLDQAPKLWRLIADICNDIGLTLDVLSPFLSRNNQFTFILLTGVSAALKTVCGYAAGTSKAVISAHLARTNNFGDVASKEAAQETLVTLIGLFIGVPLARIEVFPIYAKLIVFFLLTALHILANIWAVRSLRLRTLTRHRLSLLLANFFSSHALDRTTIAAQENILLPPPADSICLGSHYLPSAHTDSSSTLSEKMNQELKSHRFTILPPSATTAKVNNSSKPQYRVLLAHSANQQDFIVALFQATALRYQATTTRNKDFASFKTSLQKFGWDLDQPRILPDSNFRYSGDNDDGLQK